MNNLVKRMVENILYFSFDILIFFDGFMYKFILMVLINKVNE